MALRLPLCLFNRHAPRRNKVRWDGLNFVGTCRFCSKPIRKVNEKIWRRDTTPKQDAEAKQEAG